MPNKLPGRGERSKTNKRNKKKNTTKKKPTKKKMY